jgi:hypothetical protein
MKIAENPLKSPKEAAQTAAKYLRDLIPTAEEILLEEVEKTTFEGKQYWNITLSFVLRTPGAAAGAYFMQPRTREFKSFQIDPDSGEVVAMRIREV